MYVKKPTNKATISFSARLVLQNLQQKKLHVRTSIFTFIFIGKHPFSKSEGFRILLWTNHSSVFIHVMSSKRPGWLWKIPTKTSFKNCVENFNENFNKNFNENFNVNFNENFNDNFNANFNANFNENFEWKLTWKLQCKFSKEIWVKKWKCSCPLQAQEHKVHVNCPHITPDAPKLNLAMNKVQRNNWKPRQLGMKLTIIWKPVLSHAWV